MAATTSPRAVLCLVLLLLPFAFGKGEKQDANQKTWCVAKPSTEDLKLKNNIEYACSRIDCRVLGKGGPCFIPDTLISHASVAMNLYYQAHGRKTSACSFGSSGLVAIADPSYGKCKYESG